MEPAIYVTYTWMRVTLFTMNPAHIYDNHLSSRSFCQNEQARKNKTRRHQPNGFQSNQKYILQNNRTLCYNLTCTSIHIYILYIHISAYHYAILAYAPINPSRATHYYVMVYILQCIYIWRDMYIFRICFVRAISNRPDFLNLILSKTTENRNYLFKCG